MLETYVQDTFEKKMADEMSQAQRVIQIILNDPILLDYAKREIKSILEVESIHGGMMLNKSLFPEFFKGEIKALIQNADFKLITDILTSAYADGQLD